MKTWITALIAAALFTAACSQNKGEPPKPSTEGSAKSNHEFTLNAQHIDEVLSGLTDSGELVGVSALIYQGGEEVYFGAHGMADREQDKPMARDTLVRIYSMTKPITGVVLMTLYEEGKFKLDDPLKKYAPEFADMQVYAGEVDGEPSYEPAKRPITIRDIMRHTAGFYSSHIESPVGELYQEADPLSLENTLADMAKTLGDLPLAFQPGTQWLYGPSVDVQAYLAERLAGKPFEQLVHERVLEPLQMQDTSYRIGDKRDRLARAYTRHEDGNFTPIVGEREPANAPFLFDWPMTPGGWGLISSLGDYMRFARMLLNGGELDGVRILKPETIELMATDMLPETVTDTSWLPNKGQVGFGIDFAVRTAPPVDAQEASGAVGEFFWDGAANTLFWVDPKNDLTAVLFTQYFPFGGELHKTFRDAVYHNHPTANALQKTAQSE